jgi:hypothetical protein
MTRPGVPIAAVVIGACGGERLARSLTSVAWAAERIVWDPAFRLGEVGLPDGARRVDGPVVPEPLADAPWILLLREGEVVPDALAGEAAAVVGRPDAPVAVRVPLEVHDFGMRCRLPGARIRLARREAARLVLTPAIGLGLASRGGGRLAAPLVAEFPASVDDIVDEVDAHGAALAALLHARGVEPRLHRVLAEPIAVAARTACARGRLGWARWIMTVVAGYSVLVAYAKLWELRRDRVTVLP